MESTSPRELVSDFPPQRALHVVSDSTYVAPSNHDDAPLDKVLPLPGWLRKLYFIFPVVLYVPDVIFNYVVYSEGVQPQGNTVLYVASVVLWCFLSVGVVGMAYLLSVLAPWHWGQGHRIQAFFCGIGVVIATVITTWNSLAFRSRDFVKFPTDDWAYSLWPQLHANGVSITMILVAIAPPFWGLFWAIVQPTQTGRSLRQLQESHEERLLRMEQDAELKRLKAETNAKVREAQLRGMAATAAAAKHQAAQVFTSSAHASTEEEATDSTAETAEDAAEIAEPVASSAETSEPQTVQPDPAEQPQASTKRTPAPPIPGSAQHDRLIRKTIQGLRAKHVLATPQSVAIAMRESLETISPHVQRILDAEETARI